MITPGKKHTIPVDCLNFYFEISSRKFSNEASYGIHQYLASTGVAMVLVHNGMCLYMLLYMQHLPGLASRKCMKTDCSTSQFGSDHRIRACVFAVGKAICHHHKKDML